MIKIVVLMVLILVFVVNVAISIMWFEDSRRTKHQERRVQLTKLRADNERLTKRNDVFLAFLNQLDQAVSPSVFWGSEELLRERILTLRARLSETSDKEIG